MTDNITAADVKLALRDYYPPGEYAVAYEVARGTGVMARRHLDMIAMNLWPSRGHTINGIEVKVSRSDWRREKAEPAKAEEIAQFCDYFYVAAPIGVIPKDEIPDGWGHLEYRLGKIRQTKAATKLSAKPVDRHFVAAFVRSARRPDDDSGRALEKKITEKLQAQFDARLQRELDARKERAVSYAENWKKLKDFCGENYLDPEDAAAAIRMVHKAGVVRAYGHISSLKNSMRVSLSQLETAIAEFEASQHDQEKEKQ